jgi:N6-L-threonylcarbamoyladenine synthase
MQQQSNSETTNLNSPTGACPASAGGQGAITGGQGGILAIESSCDETAAAVCKDGKILSNFIADQKVHEAYGGVVPELASRAHMQNIIPVVDEAIKQAGISLNEIDAIAFTQAPGLIGSLLVGSQFAKSLAIALNKPLIAVHHMQAHVLANLLKTLYMV